MFRMIVHEALTTLAALAGLALAALTMAHLYGPVPLSDLGALPAGLAHLDRAAIGTAARLAAYAASALLAVAIVARDLAALILLRRHGYAPTAHLLAALRQRAVQRAGAIAGALLAFARLTATAQALPVAGTTGAPSTVSTARTVSTVSTAPRPSPTAQPCAGPADTPGPAQHRHTPRPVMGPRRARVARSRRWVAPRRLSRRLTRALLYTVQPGDTLTLIAGALYGDPAAYTRIVAASRGMPQPDGRALADPHWIYPGWVVRVPLPLAMPGVAGEHLIYVVQPGDTLSAIAARFLGNAARFPAIAALNRGIAQADGRSLQDSDLIAAGWVLRLPAVGRVVTYAPVLAGRTAHPWRVVRQGVRRRSGTGRRPTLRLVGQPALPPRSAPRPQPVPVGQRPAGRPRRALIPRRAAGRSGRPAVPLHTGARRALRRGVGGARHGRVVRRTPAPHAGQADLRQRIVPARRPARGAAARAARAPSPRPSRSPAATDLPTALAGVATPAPTAATTATAWPGASRRAPGPALPLPDGRGFLPTAFAVAFLLVLYRLARGRLRTRGPVAWPRLAGALRARVSPAMRRAIDATRTGMPGRLETLVRARLAGTTGHPVGHVLAALEMAGAAAGVPDLAGRVRYVLEGPERLTLVVEAQNLAPEAVPRLAARLSDTLGTPVTPGAPTQEPDGASCLTLEVRRAPLTLLGPLRVHPAPLIVPLAQTENSGVVHLSVARTSGLLIAGGPYGANTLVAGLVASALAQAAPGTVRLLVASDDEELRDALGGLDALAVPPVDADDAVQTAALVGQAFAVLLERFARGGRGPDEPAYLVLVDNVERLGAQDGALGHIESLCRNGRLCGVHLVATTSDVAALHAAALVDAFGVRLLRELPAQESRFLHGDDAATTLGAGAALLAGGPALLAAATRLVPFALPLPDLREVVAALVAAESGTALPTVDVSAGAPTSPTPPQADGSPVQSPTEAPPTLPSAEATGTAAAADPVPAPRPASPDLIGEAPDAGPAMVPAEGPPAAACAAPSPDAAAPAVPDGMAPEARPIAPAAVPPVTVAGGTGAAEDDTPSEGMAGPPVSLRLFGGVALAVHGVTVPLPPRGRRVLAALALLGPGPVHAERIADRLYGTDGGDEDAEPVDPADVQERVQRGLSDVRARVRRGGLSEEQAAAIITYKEPTYVVDPTLVEIDLHRFDDLVARAEEAPPEERGALLAAAVELYKGDLCGDQTMEWVELEYRYPWRKKYLSTLYDLADHRWQVVGDVAGALRLARRLVEEDPYNEHDRQLLMRLYHAAKDFDAVTREFMELQTLLAENGLAIHPYTRALYERLTARRAPAGQDNHDTMAG